MIVQDLNTERLHCFNDALAAARRTLPFAEAAGSLESRLLIRRGLHVLAAVLLQSAGGLRTSEALLDELTARLQSARTRPETLAEIMAARPEFKRGLNGSDWQLEVSQALMLVDAIRRKSRNRRTAVSIN